MFYLAQFTENINSNIISLLWYLVTFLYSAIKRLFGLNNCSKSKQIWESSHSHENINPEDKLTRASTHSSCRVCSPWQPESVCLWRSPILLKDLWQPGQEYFLFWRWVCRWALRLDLSAKVLAQWVQEKGFSPEWVLMWPCRSHGREKDFPHSGHLQGNVWVLMCIFRADWELYTLRQWGHDKSFVSWLLVCNCRCFW